ncbi:transketolase [Sulfitobacter sp. BSw21498]|uniref:transketolase n=1 Tax=Sulfitobacter sp. BSw21498 TaxID=664426 RepID=UPI0020C75F0D|nr:transketolase [Sulfitobacter sp. BSw21498]
MKFTPLACATILACAVAPVLNAGVALPSATISSLTVPMAQDSQIVKIKNDKEKGPKKAKKEKPKKEKHKKEKHANKEKKHEKQAKKLEKKFEKHDKVKVKIKRSKEDRSRISSEILEVRAPEGRDMSVLLGAVPLALLGSQIAFADVPEEKLLTYRNCPPGLAKMDPPCVPPGLAKKGVTYEEWVAYDDKQLDDIYLDQREYFLDRDIVVDGGKDMDRDIVRDENLDRDVFLDDDTLLLSSDQIASLYDLRPAPADKRYALIDGQPVLLTHEDYTSLLRINELARVENLPEGVRIAPTAALTQNELRQTYKLPQLETGNNYAVVNGELVTLQDSAFETLQLIRIARAIF